MATQDPTPERHREMETSTSGTSAESVSSKRSLNTDQVPTSKDRSFLAIFKKVGVSVWIAVMVIGGILAFFTALFLL